MATLHTKIFRIGRDGGLSSSSSLTTTPLALQFLKAWNPSWSLPDVPYLKQSPLVPDACSIKILKNERAPPPHPGCQMYTTSRTFHSTDSQRGQTTSLIRKKLSLVTLFHWRENRLVATHVVPGSESLVLIKSFRSRSSEGRLGGEEIHFCKGVLFKLFIF